MLQAAGLALVLAMASETTGAPPHRSRSPRTSHPRAPAAEDLSPRRAHNRSPAYPVEAGDTGFFMNYTGYALTNGGAGARFFVPEIEPKAAEMIRSAERFILLSVFLFDNFYAGDTPPRDLVTGLTDLLIERKQAHPKMTIAILFDPSHKGYGEREAPAERRLREHGVDVFYSDLLADLHRGGLIGVREGLGHANRVVDRLTFNLWGNAWQGLFGLLKMPVKFDDEPVTLSAAYNAVLLKANHRKLLVTDAPGGGFEALVSSGNPHNPSAYHVNSALSVRGAPAAYLYEVLRLDARHSVGLGRRYARWHDVANRAYRGDYFETTWPRLPETALAPARAGDANVTVITEREIPRAIIDMLDAVRAQDEVRIQMFYLSYQPVLDAILRASRVTDRPVRLLLDANKDSFNRVKDGTPNRQVARYLLEAAAASGGRIEVRWYSTHGEQNHTKTISITSDDGTKNVLSTGSCNWTGRNLAGVNMEANVVVEGAPEVNAKFNRLFDRFWSNADGNEYSLPYEAFDATAGAFKWRLGERPFYWSGF